MTTASVEFVEVGPRDGLQNERTVVSTADKLELIARAIAAGARRLEVTSFVNPARVPQMADADAVCVALPDHPGVTYIGLVMNGRGADRAIATGRINTPGDFWQHPQNLARGRLREIGSPAGPITSWLPPGVSSAYEARMDPIPGLGEHSDSVLRELGFADGDIGAMRADGVI